MHERDDDRSSVKHSDLKRLAGVRDVAAALGHIHGMREIVQREREDLRDAHVVKMHVPPPRSA